VNGTSKRRKGEVEEKKKRRVTEKKGEGIKKGIA